MLHLTIREALDPAYEVEGYAGHLFYLIREGDTVFYIGQSLDPLLRLENHLTSSAIGEVVRTYAPHSLTWTMELLTLADCAPWTDITALDMDVQSHRLMVERALIAHYRPCCNKANNPRPSPFPPQYRQHLQMPADYIGQTDHLY